MSLMLKWANNTVGDFITEIYRSDAAFTSANKPATPIATLTAGESAWLDTTAVQGNSYYYMWASYDKDRTRVAYSGVVRLTAVEYSGPGQTALSWGSNNLGFYGPVGVAVLPGLNTLLTNEYGATFASNVGAKSQPWLKYAYKGKILFISQGAVVQSSWNNIYAAGMVYGDIDQDTIPGAPSGAARVNKVARVKNGTDEFIVRMVRGFKQDLSVSPDFATLPTTAGAATQPAALGDNEYDMLMLGAGDAVPANAPAFLCATTYRIRTQCAESDATRQQCYVRGTESASVVSAANRNAQFAISTTTNDTSMLTAIVLELVRK